MGIPGPLQLLIIFGVIILLFGAKKLPDLGGAIGESLRNFRKGLKDAEEEEAKKIDDGKGSNKN